ncbi:alcohol dehydrogenase catalytic domain-containing protein [Mesorhizobium sp. CAU 1741]|uniref:zinc-dependent alcohol dehydrogenase n=1 Tax=Mesorhizobium sp. CAU 1741 TaxID=3140366 RepID=UPI00325BEE7A
MEGLFFDGEKRVRLGEVDPHPHDAGDVELRATLAGICGTDLAAVAKGTPPVAPGTVLGHEFVAVRCDDGRRVVVNPLIGCGQCDLCASGRDYICRKRAVIGIHRPGAFTRTVFAPESSLFDAGGLSDRQAVMVEPIATALHACRLSGLADRIAIIGAGAIGLSAVFVLRQLGRTEVTVTDPARCRLDYASAMGADVIEGRLSGEFEAVIDCAGATSAREDALAASAPGGRAVFVGLQAPEFTFRPGFLISGERSLLGSFGYNREEFKEAIGLAANFDEAWVHEISLSQAEEAFNGMIAGGADPGHVKTHVRIN